MAPDAKHDPKMIALAMLFFVERNNTILRVNAAKLIMKYLFSKHLLFRMPVSRPSDYPDAGLMLTRAGGYPFCMCPRRRYT